MKKGKKGFSASHIFFLVAGIVLLVMCFAFAGIGPMLRDFRAIGHRFWIIVSIHIISNVMLALAWRILFTREISWKYFPKFVAARMAGDSTTFINALGSIAGEPLKALYIKDIVPLKEGLATIFLDRTIHSISSVLIMFTGVITALFVLDLPPVAIATSLILSISLFVIMLMVLKKQSEGILEYIIIKTPDFITKKFITEERMKHIRILDDEIKLILNNKAMRRPIIACLLLHYFGILIVSTLEIYLIIMLTNTVPGFSVVNAMFVYIFGFILTSAMFFIPANLGTGEGSYALALMLLGFPQQPGVTIGFIRRLRSFAWTLIGLTLMLLAGMKKKGLTADKVTKSEH